MANQIPKFENGSLNQKLMTRFSKIEFLTGTPKRVLKAGYLNKKLHFISFETERGMEDFHGSTDCLAVALGECDTMVSFRGLKEC